MPKKRHLMTGSIYESQGVGVVLVTRTDGVSGVFDDNGLWIEGVLREADPHMCLWVGGRQLPAHLAGNTKDMPLKSEEAKTLPEQTS